MRESVCVCEVQCVTHLGANTFQTMRCLLSIAAAQTEAKTCAHTHTHKTQTQGGGVRGEVCALTIRWKVSEFH